MNDLAKRELEFVQPGVYFDMPNERYHGKTMGYSSSFLKLMLEYSPAKVLVERNNFKPTAAMRLGTAVHTLVMEPHKFDAENYIITAKGYRAFDEAQLLHPDKNIITQDQFEDAKRMADNVLNHPLLKHLFKEGTAEASVFQWYNGIDRDDHTPYKKIIKVRPDWLVTGHSCIIDLKSAIDGSWSGFGDAIIKFRYDLSAAMYKFVCNGSPELLEHCGVHAFNEFIFVVVENTPPYQVSWYKLTPDDMEHGLRLCELAMHRLQKAEKDNWPPYIEDLQTIQLPPYAKKLPIIQHSGAI